MKYVQHQKVPMRTHPQLSEKWVQQLLVDDPSLLGLGDLTVKEVERRQPHAGRLDMLLSDPDSGTRYEVELQLGATDESHIIRTIEYWDSERKRYPQYEHVAVIVAEDITSRFFNVISLFNGFIPIVAIQVSAITIDDQDVTLVFTKVLDQTTLATDEEDEGEPTDRRYWESRSTPEMMALVDQMIELVRIEEPGIEPKYNKNYVGLARQGVAKNYVAMHARKNRVNLSLRIPRSDEVTALIDEVGIDTLPYSTRWTQYRLVITPQVLDENRELIVKLIDMARDAYGS